MTKKNNSLYSNTDKIELTGLNWSKSLQLSREDGLKSIRDMLIISVGGIAPKIFETLSSTDFGEYSIYVQMWCAMLAPLVYRFLRNK